MRNPSAFVSNSVTFGELLERKHTRTTCKRRRTIAMRPNLVPLRLLNGRQGRSSLTSPAPAAGDLSAELKRRIQMLYVAHVSENGVDYNAMRASPEFSAYVEETRRLPQIDLATALPDDAHKIAFFVNLYNALTQHAVTVVDPPPRVSLLRLWYGVTVGYQVGQHRLSLNDMENGILRANRNISVLPRPFGKKDPRRELCVETVDPRIHFVLNCAANSCPPVLFLTVENLQDSLSIATKGFLGNDENFRIEGSRVLLSKIFAWYRRDFSADGSDKGLLEFVLENSDGNQEKVQSLRNIMQEKTDVTLGWLPYDWSLNSSS